MGNFDTSLLDSTLGQSDKPLGGPVPKDPTTRGILQAELAKERKLMEAEQDPEVKQRHAANIVSMERNLAGKLTETAPSSDARVVGVPESQFPAQPTDYVAQVRKGGAAPPNTTPPSEAPPTRRNFDTSILERYAPPPQAAEPTPAPQPGSLMRSSPIQNIVPGGAVTGMTGSKRTVSSQAINADEEVSPESVRQGLEAGGATVGEIAGSRAGRLGQPIGAFFGGAAGSLAAQPFDPVTNPGQQAVGAGVAAALGSGLSLTGGALFRRLIGAPNEAGQWLIAQAEKTGTVPSLSAAIPDSSLLRIAHAMGQSDLIFGQRVTDALDRTRGQMTQEVRDYINSYLRTKLVARQAYRTWDSIKAATVGDDSVVPVSPEVYNATLPLIRGWRQLGLDANEKVNLVRKFEDAKALSKVLGAEIYPNLSLSEAEALNTRLNAAANSAEKGVMTGVTQIAGTTYATQYKKHALQVDSDMQAAIVKAMQDKRMPADALATLQGARNLWTQWKQGESVLKVFDPILKQANREGTAITSTDIQSSITQIEKSGEPISEGQKDYLSKLAVAIKQAEKSERPGMFMFVVRAGQLGLAMGGLEELVSGGLLAQKAGAGPGTGPMEFVGGAVTALTPTTLAWIMSNDKAKAMILRGMQVPAGSPLAGRLTRQFITMGIKDGIFPPDRAYNETEIGKVQQNPPGPQRLQFGPSISPALPGVSGEPVPNLSPTRQSPGAGVRG